MTKKVEKQNEVQEKVKRFVDEYNKLCTKHQMKLQAVITKNGPSFELINTKPEE